MMYSSFGHAAFAALLLLFSGSLVFSSNEIGYYADENQEQPVDVVDINSVCPTDKPLRRRGMCRMDNGDETECLKMECCDSHVFISGRCISKDVDPCSLGMCEQACEVKEFRFWCKCHTGFQFHPTNYRNKMQPYCVDVDECSERNGGCDMICVNDPGGFHCECEDPYTLADDGRTCLPSIVPVVEPEPLPLIRAKSESKCYSTCETVSKLSNQVTHHKHRIHTLERKLEQLMKNSPRMKYGNFPGSTTMNRVLDSTAPLVGGYCRCERGSRGPVGPPGMAGPRGEPGDPGPPGEAYSFENMASVLADVFEDIENIKKAVFSRSIPEPVDLKKEDTVPSNRKTGENSESTAITIDINADTLETATADPSEIAETSIMDGDMTDINSSSYDFFLKHLRLLAISTSQDDGEDNSYEYEGTEYD